jgi:hypothetical protein
MATIQLASGEAVYLDAEDMEIAVGNRTIGTASWCVKKTLENVYAVTGLGIGNRKTKILRMHRLILGLDDPALDVDHIDGDGLNNRRSNLRAVTRQQNTRNMHRGRGGTSRFSGVSWYKSRSRWKSYIGIDGKQRCLGYFSNEEEAARAYDRAALEIDPNWLTNEKAGRFK